MPWHTPTLPIDCANPVNRTHWHNRGKRAWLMAVPGLAGGSRLHDLIGGRHGTLTNMGASATSGWTPAQRPGGFGGLAFDGTDDRVAVSIPIAATHTIGSWVRLDAAGSFPMICSAAGNLELRFNSSTAAPAYNLDGTHAIFSPTAFTLGTWHRVVATSDTATIRLYVDGVQVVSGTGASFAGTLATVGSRGASLFLQGSIDDFAAWDRVLSAAEVVGDYQLGCQSYPVALNRIGYARPARPPTADAQPAALLMAM